MNGRMATHPSMSRPVDATAQKPTKARYWVIVFAVTLAILSYIDRVAISQAAPVMSRDLELTQSQMGYDLLGVCSRLRAVRDPRRLDGRLDGTAQSADAHRHLVVGVYGRDRLHVELQQHVWSLGSCSAPARRDASRT